MQVSKTLKNDAIAKHRQKLLKQAAEDRARADDLKKGGVEDLYDGQASLDGAADSRQKGQELKDESNRLRRYGREQSLRGLENLANGSDRYSESFSKQEKGLEDLQAGLNDVSQATDRKEGALGKINQGLAEQTAHNQSQTTDVSALSGFNSSLELLADQKAANAAKIQGTVTERDGLLNQQAEQMGDLLLAGQDFEQGTKSKQQAAQKLGQGVEARVKGESLDDGKTFHQLQQTWGEADAQRHEKADKHLSFSAMFESFKAEASKLNAKFHENAANKENARAEDLSAQAAQMKSCADTTFQRGRALEHAGQHHVAVGQQMKCCPWTYCQGVALERQGYCEIAEGQKLKAQGRQMRAQAHEKAMAAEEARVNAEQAREVSQEFQIKGHGQEVRSRHLQDRADNHEQRGQQAAESAGESAAKAAQFGEAADLEKKKANALQQDGLNQWSGGVASQRVALGKQNGALDAHNESLASESGESAKASEQVGQTSNALKAGRSLLSLSRGRASGLADSINGEKTSQAKVQDGINDYRSGLEQSTAGADKAKEAAEMLEEARGLELEGLRLQNRGQKMMLEARPKMANAAKLSAQSFDQFNKAQRQEQEGQKLIEQGNQKLAAAEILKQKAAGYEQLAKS